MWCVPLNHAWPTKGYPDEYAQSFESSLVVQIFGGGSAI